MDCCVVSVLTDKFEGASPLQNRTKFYKKETINLEMSSEQREEWMFSHGKLDHHQSPEEGSHSEEDV